MIVLYAAFYMIIVPFGNSGSIVIPYNDLAQCERIALSDKMKKHNEQAYCIEGNK